MSLTDTEHLRLAAQARDLLQNDAFVTALDRIEADLTHKWKSCSVSREDTATRERCHVMIRAIELLKGKLLDFVRTGEIVSDKIDYLNMKNNNRR